MRYFIPTLLLLAALPASPETHDELVERALAAMEFNLRDYWSYTETTRNQDGIYREFAR